MNKNFYIDITSNITLKYQYQMFHLLTYVHARRSRSNHNSETSISHSISMAVRSQYLDHCFCSISASNNRRPPTQTASNQQAETLLTT